MRRLARQRAIGGEEPGGGARGPHRDAPSRNAGGGKEAEDCSSPQMQEGRVPQAPDARGGKARGEEIGVRPQGKEDSGSDPDFLRGAGEGAAAGLLAGVDA
jgi:hypothetical protein